MPPDPPAGLESLLEEKVADSLVGPLPALTPRRVVGPVLLPGKATAVVGTRRAGKTTFLHQVRRERLEAGRGRERIPYVNFEDERLGGLRAEHLQLVPEVYFRLHPEARRGGPVTWGFDEIQVVPGWERFVRRLLDEEPGVEILLSGSSATLLSREIATALRGRAWEVVLHPFGFEEALRHGGDRAPPPRRARGVRERSRLERALRDYLTVGGFPEVQGLDGATRRRLLRDYVDVAMLRDVVERHGVTNVAGLRWMVRHLLGNPAGRFSVEKFYAGLRSGGLAIAKDTVHELLAHLEDCFLVRTVWMETRSERQRMVNPRKSYPVDPGLIPVFDRTGRANLGHALETAVMVELERRRREVTYVRTPGGREVDFLARCPDGGEELIQVCADASDPDTAGRELRALEEASALFPRATRRLLTLSYPPALGPVPEGILVQRAHEWFLEGAEEGAGGRESGRQRKPSSRRRRRR